jgi:AraC-like DNA-binding protein
VNHQGESIRFWQTAPLAGVELLSARYIEHRFAPHVHDGYVIGMIMAGAQRYRYRGAEHLAGSGTLVLINPDELHTGHKGTEDGWLYRAFYPDSGQILSLLAELELPTRPAGVRRHAVPRSGSGEWLLPIAPLAGKPGHRTATTDRLARTDAFIAAASCSGSGCGKPGKEHRGDIGQGLLQTQLAAPPSLEELAAAVNLSPFHFARVFRRATGMPPHTWLMQQRIATARALLQTVVCHWKSRRNWGLPTRVI